MPNPEGGNQFFSNNWMSSSQQNAQGNIGAPGMVPWNVVDPVAAPKAGQNIFGNMTPEALKNVPNVRQLPNGQWSDGEGRLYDPNTGSVFYSPGPAGSSGPGLYFGDVPAYAPTPNVAATPQLSSPAVATPNPAGNRMLQPTAPINVNQPTPVNTIPVGQQTTQPVTQTADARAPGAPTTTWNIPAGTGTVENPNNPFGTPLVPETPNAPTRPETTNNRTPTTTIDPATGLPKTTVPGVAGNPLTPGPSEPRLTPGDADSQFYIVSPQDPQMQQNFFSWLKTNIGAGATPFPEDLNASRDPLLSALYNFYSTGQGDTPAAKAILQILNNPKATIPDIINQMAESGLPVDRTQAWQAMVAAQQRNIDRTAADLRGQFAFSGNLAGTPFAQAMVDFYGQAAKDQNATLASWTAQSLEAARGRQMSAGEMILNSGERGQDRLTSLGTFLANSARDLGGIFQGLSQQDIDRTLNEFVRTRPEYSPLLNLLFSASTTFPPTLQKRTGLGIGGALLSSLPSLLSKLPDLLKKTPTGTAAPTKTGDPKVDSKQPIDVKLSWILPTIAQLMESGMNRPLVDNLLGQIGDLFGNDVRTSIETKINYGGGYLDLTMEDITTIMDDLWSTDYGSGGGGGSGSEYDKWWEWFMDNYWNELGG